MKTVFHLNEIDRLNVNISNINNLLKTDIKEVVLLINGNAINLFKEESFNIDIIDPRFKIMVCNNSMTSNNISTDQLLEGTIVAASGVYTLSDLQVNHNFAYIKV